MRFESHIPRRFFIAADGFRIYVRPWSYANSLCMFHVYRSGSEPIKQRLIELNSGEPFIVKMAKLTREHGPIREFDPTLE